LWRWRSGRIFETGGVVVSHRPTLLYTVPWAVAIEQQGYYEERGISLDEIAGYSGGGEMVRNVVTRGPSLGVVATPTRSTPITRDPRLPSLEEQRKEGAETHRWFDEWPSKELG